MQIGPGKGFNWFTGLLFAAAVCAIVYVVLNS